MYSNIFRDATCIAMFRYHFVIWIKSSFMLRSTAKGHILWRGLEWGGDWYVLEITKQSATEVSGMMYLEFSEQGTEEPAVSKKPVILRIKNKRLFLSAKIPMAGMHKKRLEILFTKIKILMNSFH